ncbi:acyl-CoA thioester hydrolase [Sphingomonas gellani]|uniref:Acyl-CoA thioester hydrolase n=1 Tax=Sphingomonas gellani TaxID=1166340 RepID=A0A1H8DPP1_9SPHN|nr:acyl-CoA thioesterase [Sphingomonas gellani]SEN08487.1 acyl-CoA thioester hydrolase [Sphingomonas gellani]
MMRFNRRFVAASDDIDELGHVNNAVWVRWIQDVAVAHWDAVAPADHRATWFWVVTRHEIDYRGNLTAGQGVTAETWVADAPRGARFDRNVRFTGDDGRVLVEAVTTWAMIDRATGRLSRIRPDVAAPFLEGRPSGTSGPDVE